MEPHSGCTILESGNVNCSISIYNDRKIWKKSRNNIDAQIQQLRQKIEDLKEIRRHLKIKRPIQSAYEDLIDDKNSKEIYDNERKIINVYNTSMNIFENFTGTTTSESNKNNVNNFHKPRTSQNGNKNIEKIRPSRRKYDFLNIFPNASLYQSELQESNTTTKSVEFTNHHRHHHKLHTISDKIDESHLSFTLPSVTPQYEEMQNTTEALIEIQNKISGKVNYL